MRCIEMLQRICGMRRRWMINSNMRCIEMRTDEIEQLLETDKQ